ncbi:MAG: response regulator [Gemmatimonadota bacterium]|nr:response regulator [Gemmatimonadota bacterium]
MHREYTSVARILIVDDEEADRRLIQAILERAGYETVLVADGEEALSACLSTQFDIVITDLQMPKVHGFELITALRDTDQPPAIIAVSGTGHHQLAIADALGAKFTLSKPANPDAVLEAVGQLLRGRG